MLRTVIVSFALNVAVGVRLRDAKDTVDTVRSWSLVR